MVELNHRFVKNNYVLMLCFVPLPPVGLTVHYSLLKQWPLD